MARQSTGSNRQHLIAFAAMLGLLLGGIAKTEAADYTFTKIADTAGDVSRIPPALNDKGVLAFFPDMTSISTGDGISTWTVADTNGPVNFFFFSSPSISDSGVLAFRAFLDAGVSAIVRTDGIATTTIPEQGSGVRVPGNPSVNDDGAVAFLGFDGTGSGIFVSDGIATTPIAHTPNPFTSFRDNPSLSDRGAVAFLAFDAAGSGIFRRDGTTNTTIAHTSDPLFSGFGLPFLSLNNEGAVAFWASLDAGGDGIFVSDGTTPPTPIADSTGPSFNSFAAPSINDKGVVAFWASLDDGRHGIFTGPDPVAHKVIATGDTLDGSTVTFLTFGREGLNNGGQVAFVAQLDGLDGRRVVYRADPVPSNPVPSKIEVSIDIKPGGDPNSINPINPKSQGTVPVAILTKGDFDATTVDPMTVTLAGAHVKLKKNGMPMAAYEDVNGDGRADLVVHVSTQELIQDLRLDESSTEVVLRELRGQTFDKMPITGRDKVRIVP